MPKSKRGFGLGALTQQGQRKRSDYKSERIRGDDGGNDTLDVTVFAMMEEEHTVSVER